MTTLTFRVPDSLADKLDEMCREQDRTKSWFMKRALQEKMEEWHDVKIALKGRAEYENNPGSFLSHEKFWEEVKKQKKSK